MSVALRLNVEGQETANLDTVRPARDPRSRNPIFIHSLWRSGSTYIFNVFRRAGDQGEPLYTAFQEPIHELVPEAANQPEFLLADAGAGQKQRLLRHPELDAPYFKELYEVHAAWRNIIAEEIVYSDYFGSFVPDKTAGYLAAIIASAPRRPVIQECRTSLRIDRLKAALGGVHIHLWRNPWDQWWSFKTDGYFDTALQLILNAPQCPSGIETLKRGIDFPTFGGVHLRQQFEFYNCRRPTAETSYLTFFTLWLMALEHGHRAADVDINIDLLSRSKAYRQSVASALEAVGISGLDFSDARAPQAYYGEADVAFFRPLELRAREILMQSGYQASTLDALEQIRANAMPVAAREGIEDELARVREVVRRIETREARLLSRCMEEFDRLRVQLQIAEQRAERLEADAVPVSTKRHHPNDTRADPRRDRWKATELRTKKPSILMELRPAFDGFAGIPQETRLIFSALASMPEFELAGLLIHGSRHLSRGLERGRQYSEAARVDVLSRHVACYGDDDNKKLDVGRLVRLQRLAQRAALHARLKLTTFVKQPISLTEFDPEHFRDFLWSNLFSKTLSPEDMDQVLSARYAILSPPYAALHRLGKRRFRPSYARIDTHAYDFILSQTPFPGRVSRETQLVVRYHDAIPLFLPHTISSPRIHQRTHYAALLDNCRHAFFVCTSEATRTDLLRLFPQLEGRSTVIHDIVSHEYFVQEAPAARIVEIIANRMDKKTHGKNGLRPQAGAHFNYIMVVSTIEPRKNHLALISAWEQLRAEKGSDIKLVFVGSLGWSDNTIKAVMQNWQERGELFHLSGVPASELRVLYQGAEAVVCPSVCEGFDYAGVEAMLCGTAVVASRIPAHTEIYGDCAEYFNPYSAAQMSAAIARITFPRRNDRRRSLIEQGLVHARRYTRSEIIPLWQELFLEKALMQSRISA